MLSLSLSLTHTHSLSLSLSLSISMCISHQLQSQLSKMTRERTMDPTSSRKVTTPTTTPTFSSQSTPIIIPTGGSLPPPPPPPHTVTTSTAPPHSTSGVIERFIRDTDRISCGADTPPCHPTPLRTQATTTERERTTVGHYVESGRQGGVRGLSPPPPPLASSAGFIPLRPVSSRDVDTAEYNSCVGGKEGRRGGGEGGERGEGEGGERGGGEGVLLSEERGNSSCETKLEDVFSRNLDSIVNHHFQQLDSSLKKLMSKQT